MVEEVSKLEEPHVREILIVTKSLGMTRALHTGTYQQLDLPAKDQVRLDSIMKLGGDSRAPPLTDY